MDNIINLAVKWAASRELYGRDIVQFHIEHIEPRDRRKPYGWGSLCAISWFDNVGQDVLKKLWEKLFILALDHIIAPPAPLPERM